MTVTDCAIFEPWLQRWALVPDGEPIITPGSRLLPVRFGDTPAMLKVALDTDEQFGNRLMTWWDGEGAAQVLAHHEEGLLLERAMGRRSLMHMALNGEDDEATQIMCTSFLFPSFLPPCAGGKRLQCCCFVGLPLPRSRVAWACR